MDDFLKDIKTHFHHYLALLVILNLGVGMFYFLRYSPGDQVWVVLATSVAYVAWGVIHHWLEEDLHLKIVLEYFLMAFLACLLIIFLLLRA